VRLPSKLSQSTLGDLLGALHRAGTTGVLELVELGQTNGRTHRIHLTLGLVSGVETSARVPPLGEILVREGLMESAAQRRLLGRIASGDGRPSGEILIAEGLSQSALVDRALRAQLRHKLDALFRIQDASVSFHVARGPAAKVPPLLPLEFLHHRPRRRDGEESAPASHEHARLDERFDRPPPSGARPRAPFVRTDPERARALAALGLNSPASVDEIRKAFRQRALALHPDRAGALAPAERARRAAELSRVTAAYHRLVA
jgi:hypothetical protein